MMIEKMNFYLFNTSIVYIISSILSTIICITKHSNTDVAYYYIPFAFFICLVTFRFYRSHSNQLSIRIIEILMIIRYVITPVSYYYRIKEPLSFDLSYATLGLFYMIYEMVMVFFTLNIYANNIFITKNVKLVQNTKLGFKDLGIQILVILFILTLAIYPQYLHNLLSFSFEALEEVETGSSVNGMFNLIYKSGSIIISCLLLSKFENNNGSVKSLMCCLSVCWVCVWFCSLGTSGLVSRTSFLTNGIIFTIITIKFYPQFKKSIVSLSFGVVLSMLILGTISRFYNNNSTSFLTDMLDFEMLDSYFGGLRDVMVSIKMEDIYGNQLGFTTFFNDLFAGMPFVASRSGIDFDMRSSFFFNATFFGRTGILSRIIPIIGQGYVYFGPILAPIPTVLCVWAALKLNKKMNESSDTISFYMYCLMMYFFSAYSMYNMNTIAGGFWNKVLPILIVVILNNIVKQKITTVP